MQLRTVWCVAIGLTRPSRLTPSVISLRFVGMLSFDASVKEKKQIEICDKIISKSGFEEFFVGDQMGSSSDYNSIKDAVDQKRKGGN